MSHVRSVQLAVMAAPTTTVVEAVAAARRRHEHLGRWITLEMSSRRALVMAGATAA